jgi:hypothetical protein
MNTMTQDVGRWAIMALMAARGVGMGAEARYDGGTGKPNDPYKIATADQMSTIGRYEEDWDKHFILVQDVNLAPYPDEQFNRIGRFITWIDTRNKPFTGVFDGRGKTTEQLQTRSTFTDAGWDFVGEDTNGTDDVWAIRKEECPRLAWELGE